VEEEKVEEEVEVFEVEREVVLIDRSFSFPLSL
jgi:hypothetical protein